MEAGLEARRGECATTRPDGPARRTAPPADTAAASLSAGLHQGGNSAATGSPAEAAGRPSHTEPVRLAASSAAGSGQAAGS